ncbi:MAG: hypothetical protein VW757_08020 [Halieaceae bacterium]|jgi:hypothetical protein
MYQSVTKSVSAAFGAIAIVGLTACGGAGPAPAPTENPNIATAKEWVTAGAAGKTEAMAAVQELMAEDGLLYRDRYVGFGFTWDPADEEGRMIVGTVTPESPVDGLLQPGDQFLSVRGVEVNEANMGKLDFRGKPGEVVDAVILRDGESMDISVARGIIDTPISKAQMLAWMDTGDADTWGPDKWELHEAIGQGNVVYVWTQGWNTDEVSGLPVDNHTVTRFEFNDEGKVVALGNLSEDRFALEQAGWTISR